MEIKKEASAGHESKGDILISIIPLENGLEIEIASDLGESAYTHIAEMIENVANKYGITNAKIKAVDCGAMDFVILSRTETAILRASHEIEKRIYTDKTDIAYRPRRTMLFVPASNPHFFRGIPGYRADAIVLDLEDSVAPEEKDSARMLVSYALQKADFSSSEKIVRINPLDSCGAEDIEAVIQSRPDVIIIPKCESEYDIKKSVEQIEKYEKKFGISGKGVLIMPMIESARGVNNAPEISLASERITAIAFGAEDYRASIGVFGSDEGPDLMFARQVIVNAAKGSGIQAIDTVYTDIGNRDGLLESTRISKSLGFDGRGAVHPSQIDVIHSVFVPTDEEAGSAKRIVDAYKKAREEGIGVIKLDGKMIEMPIVRRAIRTLKIYEANR